MNAEYLLDAIGRLDDDLIREAERYRRPKARHGRLLGLAASFAVVIALGYVLTHFGMGGGAPGFSGGGNGGGAPASGNSMLPGGWSGAPGAAEDGNPGETPEPDTPLEGATSGGSAEEPNNSAPVWDDPAPFGEEPFAISIWLDEGGYSCIFGHPKILDELPEGCVELGKLELWDLNHKIEEPYVPYTYSEEYAGCPVWMLVKEDPPIQFYVGLPEGGYLTNG